MAESIQGLEQFMDSIKKLDNINEGIADETLRRLQEYTPTDTGKLRNSWELSVKDGEITIANTAVDEEGVYYGPFVEFGTVHMPGEFFTTRVQAEGEQILEVALQKAGL